MDFCSWAGIFLPVCCGKWNSDLWFLPASAAKVALFDTIAAVLAALVIIPAMATTGAQLNQGGPGLLFIFLPNLIRSMPGGRIIAIIFFAAVFLAGMTSLINLYEAPIATVQEKLHLSRVPACGVIAVIGIIVSLLIQGIVSTWMDILSIYICPLGAGLAESCSFGYVRKATSKNKSIKAGNGNSPNTSFLSANTSMYQSALSY